MKHILITGGAGFIGSNFINYFAKKYPNYRLFNLDVLNYASNLAYVENLPNHTFIHGDICNRALVEEIFTTHNIDSIIHFAAQSHVDNSIQTPQDFITTNIQGTFVLLDVAYRAWGANNGVFLHISTDEVFGTLGKNGSFSESSPYAPNSPYSASKAASDMLVRSYHHTYGLNTFITNCSNNYGPNQHDEKLIPTIIRNALKGEPIPIYGDGSNVRDWLFVLEHCYGLDKVFHSTYFGESFNIGGHNECSNLKLAHRICAMLDRLKPLKNGSYSQQITFVKDRLGHDKRYAINANKIAAKLAWKPTMPFSEGLAITINWYLKKYATIL